MKKVGLNLKMLKLASKEFGTELKELHAIQNTKDGGRLGATLMISDNEEIGHYINISNVITYKFETSEEMQNYIRSKFTVYKSEKDAYINGWGMDEDTWDAWNNEE